MEKEEKLIIEHILIRLRNMRKWGGAHSELKRVIKSLPTHFRESKQGRKQVNNAIKLMVNHSFLLIKPSTGELHVSLNPRKIKEISEFLQGEQNEL
ncbi:MAG: hypothetical protein PHH54_07385 [Candidatus Nanoarchaeia archaeon]|nr:hypothetical protein [Candidatus Nanoarchaeia archaeon]MDD5741778.1 hypothetical protein [Candidatus Nanoarchaeia archaeon]